MAERPEYIHDINESPGASDRPDGVQTTLDGAQAARVSDEAARESADDRLDDTAVTRESADDAWQNVRVAVADLTEKLHTAAGSMYIPGEEMTREKAVDPDKTDAYSAVSVSSRVQDTKIYRIESPEEKNAGDTGSILKGLYDDEKSGQQTFELPPLTRLSRKAPKEKEASANENESVELWKVLLAILICMLVAMGSYLVGKVYGTPLIPEEPVVIQEPPAGDAPLDIPEEKPDPGPRVLTMLLIGTDQRFKNELARADTIIFLALNLDNYNINMVSIPRDSRVRIPGYEGYNKINYAHAMGGPELTVRTVADAFGINIHYYFETNFASFEKCVDVLGGLEYNVERRMYFPEEGIDLMPGKQRLNGNKALQYVRWRGDPTADIGRVARQQKFIKAFLEQIPIVASIPKLPGLISELRENVLTDMTGAQMLNLGLTFAGNISNISFSSATLPGEAKTIGGAAYWVLDEAAALELILNAVNPPPPAPDADAQAEPDAAGAVAEGAVAEGASAVAAGV